MPSSRGSTIVDRGYGSLRPPTVATWPLSIEEENKRCIERLTCSSECKPFVHLGCDLRAEGLGQGQCRQPDRQHFPLL